MSVVITITAVFPRFCPGCQTSGGRSQRSQETIIRTKTHEGTGCCRAGHRWSTCGRLEQLGKKDWKGRAREGGTELGALASSSSSDHSYLLPFWESTLRESGRDADFGWRNLGYAATLQSWGDPWPAEQHRFRRVNLNDGSWWASLEYGLC